MHQYQVHTKDVFRYMSNSRHGIAVTSDTCNKLNNKNEIEIFKRIR